MGKYKDEGGSGVVGDTGTRLRRRAVNFSLKRSQQMVRTRNAADDDTTNQRNQTEHVHRTRRCRGQESQLERRPHPKQRHRQRNNKPKAAVDNKRNRARPNKRKKQTLKGIVRGCAGDGRNEEKCHRRRLRPLFATFSGGFLGVSSFFLFDFFLSFSGDGDAGRVAEETIQGNKWVLYREIRGGCEERSMRIENG